ncbi:2Fe-2S iron-sulfur cluster binding domain-containing protein [Coniochaeta ligniaria NRRL 30616]|uniref:2Fe-2S iron-sulfur cluster binding domain-containing protein n=1 Tax=Coniochaeta ligniaria NRRL 30616 TaxID=1408157 RepID=A0A1J7I550_9PEZI|nr:2Fe-2S iron-sulfur cluster binding domain-containing protein [Coniochaeta ligniaria NRRL 30616]
MAASTRTVCQGLARLRAVTQRPSSSCITELSRNLSTKSSPRWPTTILGSAQRQPQRASIPRAPLQRRAFSVTAAVSHGHIDTPKPGEELYVTFIDKEGQEHKIAVSKGDNLLDIAQAHDLEMEGACGGSCACSTCHVIVLDQEYYDKMPEPEDDENDMLDLAFGLTETSRLGCQVNMTKELDGLRVKLPTMTRNLQASDFK